MSTYPADIRSTQEIVFSPAEAAELGIEHLRKKRNSQSSGIPFGIKRLDEVMNPMLPGELVSVYGLPGHHKTNVLNHLSRKAIEGLPEGSREIVVRATWEQSVEDDTLHWIASDSGIPITALIRNELSEEDWEMVYQSVNRRGVSPLWIIGHSSLRSESNHRARPRMTMTDIAKALEMICSSSKGESLKIRVVVLDYLQRIRPDPQDGQERREQVMEIVNRAKDCALSFGCTTLLGVQAKREVSERENKIPRQSDAQESSNVEQTSDKIISLWYPWKTEQPNSTIKTQKMAAGGGTSLKNPQVSEETWKVTPNLLVVGIPKQKMGPIIEAVPVYVDPGRNKFFDMAAGGTMMQT
jgi:replicative DNA helicase